MTLETRLRAFAHLGQRLAALSTDNLTDELADDLADLIRRAGSHNAWFDAPNVTAALAGVAAMLTEPELRRWLTAYDGARLEPTAPRRVGVVMAGNIPLVGFHDLLAVLLSGHTLAAKLASGDPFLPRWLAGQLVEIEPGFADRIHFVERLNDAEAIIATGSDNTARYFEYYFASRPHIIRRNRTSRAVLSGYETAPELAALGEDIFRYYGLGCRNVASLLVPPGYDFVPLLDALQPWQHVLLHHKYCNNYDYQKSLLLVNREPHLDTGFLLLREATGAVSPISVLFHQSYDGKAELQEHLAALAPQTQAVVSAGGWLTGSVPFGQAQHPHVWDYADGVDTMQWLTTL